MSIGSDLCTQCGLCCTGALHDNAVADPDEVEVLRSQGFKITSTDKHLFPLPCSYFKRMSCSIYDQRPRSCARYRCRLLREVEAGTTGIAAAIAKVREAQRLVDAVKALLPAGASLPEARAMTCSETEPHLRLQVLALVRYLDLNFRHADESRILREEPLTVGTSIAASSKELNQNV
jgi:Fe-S-cluster containining protein